MFSASEASKMMSSTSIDMPNTMKVIDVLPSLKIRLIKLTNVKTEVKTL